MRLCHISDLHFGPYYSSILGESLLECLATIKPDTVVVTGDLTQRARPVEFAEAKAFLQKIESFVPTVVVCPGNHDIALYRLWERWLYPFSLYRRYIHPELDRVWETDDAIIVALNSVRPYSRLVQGKLSRKQHELCYEAFSKADRKKLRILAMHHPVGIPDQDFHHPVMDSPWSRLCGKEGLDIVLTGHLHAATVLPIDPQGCPGRIVMLSCGTTTSGRVRDIAELHNSFQLMEGERDELAIQTYAYFAEKGFLPRRSYRFGVDMEVLEPIPSCRGE